MKIKRTITDMSIRYPKFIISIFIVITLILAFFIPRIEIDTDPENMLSEDTFVRKFHNYAKKEFLLNDIIVVGVVNENRDEGVFNPKTLQDISTLTENIKTWDGVIKEDIISPSTQDNISQGGVGEVIFEWLMKEPPETIEDSLKIKNNIMSNPVLKGTMVSEDGKALALYIPIKSKDMSYEYSVMIKNIISNFNNGDSYYISGLPVAEDTFGVQMFKQMEISAPLAMIIIFILLKVFFKKNSLILSPMIISAMSVFMTMGLLIGMGYKVHIMSSMIPIFLMPIAVVDSVHILSVFHDLYPESMNKEKALRGTMDELFVPMLYTSLTTCVGFASLALTPIPPVRIFGLFVSFGIAMAWILTVTFIPSYIILFIKEESLTNFGKSNDSKSSFIEKLLQKNSEFTFTHYKKIIAATCILVLISAYGISNIIINDNPVIWFEKNHEIRKADRVLNDHFAGTYMAYLVLERDYEAEDIKNALEETQILLEQYRGDLGEVLYEDLNQAADSVYKTMLGSENYSVQEFYSLVKDQTELALDENDSFVLEDVYDILGEYQSESQTFKNPKMLEYMDRLSQELDSNLNVGKSNSIIQIVKKVYQELLGGQKENFRIPDTTAGVAQSLLSFQNSHTPQMLWHFVTPDYEKGNIWVQLKNGDNKSMQEVSESIEAWMKKNKSPMKIKHNWAGLTYVNVIWQNEMVRGMLNSLMGSFVVVFLMMAFLFKSPLWGILSMIPLSVTVLFSYGLIGLVGKSYDMPVAVLSSLTLGLSVDFAIHFIERAREIYSVEKNWKITLDKMHEKPARAVVKNSIIISVAFLPLLLAPLVPYKTVGILISAILMVSSIATFIILPALIKPLKERLFPEKITDNFKPN
ncbi:efflux RND transporter permease subunit [uncultured Ilyobacter sp.]|uniref:efflux RND transporter permease subunit n=1 Tax=uncultured Ilyobacter sp. TaxID=544433 RepID=UPI0029C0C203|nr:efflux RND transporter permease subunit [uncultured Ilyobacter sp.]